MVSKASEDFPDPDSPVMTIILLRGRVRSMCLRLCSAAPLMTMDSAAMARRGSEQLLERKPKFYGMTGGASIRGRCDPTRPRIAILDRPTHRRQFVRSAD